MEQRKRRMCGRNLGFNVSGRVGTPVLKDLRVATGGPLSAGWQMVAPDGTRITITC